MIFLLASILPSTAATAQQVPPVAATETSTPRAPGKIIKVGHSGEVTTISAAAALARDGDTVEVEAGDYFADVAVWPQRQITVRAVGGRARLIANGASAEQKAIWVVRVGEMLVERFDFIGAHVTDLNGAGIRLEKGRLTVRDCGFFDNENGILTSNDPTVELEIEGSEFGRNGAGDGYSHNLYAGTIKRLSITSSHFHHARVGHLLKSRAAQSQVLYNRLTDELGGQASYELEFPNGGEALVVGNLIQQSAQTRNPYMVAFGLEGYKWPRNELQLVHNTLVDDRRPLGMFLRIKTGADRVVAVNNLLVGSSTLESTILGEFDGNVRVERESLANADALDYRPRRPLPPAAANTKQLWPLAILDREYVHPKSSRSIPPSVRQPGALQSTMGALPLSATSR